jgi:capsule polysaccharide export protein KpsE/RkpR
MATLVVSGLCRTILHEGQADSAIVTLQVTAFTKHTAINILIELVRLSKKQIHQIVSRAHSE